MAAGFQCNIIGLTDSASAPATSAVSSNLRVKTSLGTMATLADVVSFSGTSVVGNWVVPALRCQVGHIPAINATSQGIAYSAVGAPTGPMMITMADTRATGT